MVKISRVALDTAPDLPITITDASNVAINLTGATVKFLIRNSSTGLHTNDAANTCTITNAATGQVLYSFTANDIPSGGVYFADVQVTFPTTKVQTAYSQVQITARDRS